MRGGTGGRWGDREVNNPITNHYHRLLPLVELRSQLHLYYSPHERRDNYSATGDFVEAGNRHLW
ncbi:MAG: hypothetical protein ACKO2Z_02855 [Sphaerospermopsis kisseleviana]|uniref:hypothetical protein n=1 Tax=Sphaerospermopsis sp. LEGE 00249 TaxID=1380707 RepID=UPI001C9B2300|nr:hypothetical protein [Sphaerospermopsis sp. LEGE 00249]